MVALFYSLFSASAFFWNPFGLLHATNCNVSTLSSQIDLPANQTQLVLPTNSTPSFVGLGFGVQNYTCTSGNNFTNVGAVAELIDVSCLAGSSVFLSLPDTLFSQWNSFNGPSIQDVILENHLINNTDILAQHYFITNPQTGQGVSPKWDFTSSGKFQGNQDAFVVGKGTGTIPSPNNATTDVNWLDVVAIEGEIADVVFRTDTRGGQPPASCTFGKSPDISVKYVAYYWFFGGSLGQ
ncbi:hypothetical protein EUX98_g5216 [Antrodiella citrinella]|uniref:FAS1 domain-containing protein n=1 Tax=Antrodiella citrinella TaxID=2447956 RepID=A0A4V3XIF1_9APHY|nr:hypothetical protein EUX98_g5216 [Antrodiella citrinella]